MNISGKIFAIGDDSPELFTLNKHFQVVEKLRITRHKIVKDGRVPKNLKPDFESMDVQIIDGKTSFVILGSGSKRHTREKGFVIAHDGSFKIERNLSPLYERIRQVGQFNTNQEVNIEGLASSKEKVFILNRGNSGPNMIFEVDKSDFERFITGKTESIDRIVPYLIKLPKIGGIESGLSGAAYNPISKNIFLTASVEATEGSAYDDGKILGSFVMELPVKSLIEGETVDLSHSAMLVSKDGKKLITKVESITMSSPDMNSLSGILASDNDDGTSEFFDFTISGSE